MIGMKASETSMDSAGMGCENDCINHDVVHRSGHHKANRSKDKNVIAFDSCVDAMLISNSSHGAVRKQPHLDRADLHVVNPTAHVGKKGQDI